MMNSTRERGKGRKTILRALAIMSVVWILPPSMAAASEWELLGPYKAHMTCLGLDPGHPDTVYTTDEGPILSSTDAGHEWVSSRNGMEQYSYFKGLVVVPDSPGTVYAGGNTGVYRSKDCGRTWEMIDPAFPITNDFVRAIGPKATFYASSGRSIYESTDGCKEWKKTAECPDSVTVLATSGVDPAYLLVGAATQIGISRDGGKTWTYTRVDATHPGLLKTVEQNVEFPEVLYAGTQLGGKAHGNLYRSSDGGKAWQRIILLPDAEATRLSLQVLRIKTVKADPSSVFVGTTAGVFIGRDDGRTLRLGAEQCLSDHLVFDIAIAPSVKRVYAATSDGVHVSGDLGRSWSVSFKGYPCPAIQRVAFSSSTPEILFALSPGALWRSEIPRPSWKMIAGECHSVAIDRGPPEILYARTTSIGNVSRSLNHGDSWQPVGNVTGVAQLWHYGSALYGFLDPGTRETTHLKASSDKGTTWEDLNLELPLGWRVSDVWVDPRPTAVIYVGVCPPGVYNVSGGQPPTLGKVAVPLKVCRSMDGGRTWLDVPKDKAGIPDDEMSYARLIVGSGSAAGVLYAATFLGFPVAPASVVRSLDGGAHWEAFGDQAAISQVTAIAVDPDDARTVCVGCQNGDILLSRDGAETWTALAKDREWGSANAILVRPNRHPIVYIGTDQGVFRTPIAPKGTKK